MTEPEEKWKEELENLPSHLKGSDFVPDSPEEIKEIEEAQKKLEELRKSRRPIRRWKWKPNGVALSTILLLLLEFIIISLCLYFFIPLSFPGIKLSLINTFSITFLLYLMKRWVKD